MISTMRTLAFVVLVICPFVLPLDCVGAPRDKKADAEKFHRATALLALRSRGGQPFRLRAHVTLLANNKKNEGVYSLDWYADDDWRRQTEFPDFSETVAVRDNKIWTLRSMDYIPVLIWHLHLVVQRPGRLGLRPEEKIGSVRNTKRGNSSQTCYRIQWKYSNNRELCLDDSTGLPTRHSSVGMSKESVMEFTDYMTLGDKKFPKNFTLDHENGFSIKVRVDELTLLEPAPVAFSLPVGAEVRDWCAEPKEPNFPYLHEQIRSARLPASWTGSVYFRLDANGNVSNLTVVESSHKSVDAFLAAAFANAVFKPPTCQGKPIASEYVVGYGVRVTSR